MANWCVSSNMANFDVVRALDELNKIDWKKTKHYNNVRVDDIIYFYISEPEADIRAKCKVSKESVDRADLVDGVLSFFNSDSAKAVYLDGDNKYIELELLEIYEKGVITSELLLKSGIGWRKAPQTICHVSDEMVSLIEEEVEKVKMGVDVIEENAKTEDEKYILRIEKDVPDIDYTEESLAKILEGMYKSQDAQDNQKKTTAVHMFGIKYGDIINSNRNFVVKRIVEKANLSGHYHAEVSKGIRIREAVKSGLFGISISDYAEIASNAMEESKNRELPNLSPRENHFPLNTILYGAPGTGKTYALTNKAIEIIENKPESDISDDNRADLINKQNQFVREGRLVFTTFHQNYSYEDFIQGLRPITGNDGSVSFKEVDGVFKKIADRALYDDKNNYVIVIDEINRANISKVFGELITLIEEDKRWGEMNGMSVTLPSGDVFTVPNNLYIIGTMNSSDKSIALLDAALRRRFSFEEKVPDYNLLGDFSKNILQGINRELKRELKSSDLLIGHAYFINREKPKEIVRVLNEAVIPLLYEYFYDDEEKVSSILNVALRDSCMVVINNTDQVGRIKVRLEVE